eukprot:TRINITY_DN621_c0_g1_i1.p2 TRINITY_DN621_c0_g1~~TRINITY_DN621_c0_g1_i1.p2  ORF type:complete len:234 (+),score=26.93 TRINITY_DN621_c0_g1_i1:67-768(+)
MCIRDRYYLYKKSILQRLSNKNARFSAQFFYMIDQFLMRKYVSWSENIKEIKKQQNSAEDWCQLSDPSFNITKKLYHSKLAQKHCSYVILLSLLETNKYLQQKFGKNIAGWQYGKLHQSKYLHIPFSNVPVLRSLYEVKLPSSGNRNTINCAQEEFKFDSFDAYHGANYRIIVDWAQNSTSYYASDMGMSENVFSRHYNDQNKQFFQDKYTEIDSSHLNLFKYAKKLLLQSIY